MIEQVVIDERLTISIFAVRSRALSLISSTHVYLRVSARHCARAVRNCLACGAYTTRVSLALVCQVTCEQYCTKHLWLSMHKSTVQTLPMNEIIGRS